MKKYILDIATIFLVGMSIVGTSWKAVELPYTQQEVVKQIAADSLYKQYISNIYHQVHLDSAGLSEQVFEKALTGFYNLKYSGLLHNKSILTIADFDQESRKKRLYIIDLASKKLILNTWVAHGQNSGGDKPSYFSNNINSNQSSLGFYLTGEIYNGKHGRSLKLDGMDQGFNSNARERSIVVHGASYVSQKSIDQLGRLGRSQGCPAVPAKLADQVINTISDRTVLFINNSDQQYNSSFLNETLAASVILNQEQILAAQMD
ncbi:murein L,D-transpeptidase catalytic domain family protein [Pedobacter psychrodurus]|uniref:Murein L,D-transpeptidase catalytic domain family protein n=1 Tax=Pedobacter psychrodurus TaxID=2530456 RepID=A0A4V2MR64_9SPHI|nr:murein L,D-transpeptidase catalytic domain family protein [Pedobacter psychrodurus]TCD28147.1 murein L,D-transpeptidase catalytic domain family protein [Pedobacter psychrodurus]